MAGFEKQLERIKSKAELKAFVDELEDDAVGLLLICHPEHLHENGCGVAHESYSYRQIGDITDAGALYMVRSWEHWLFGDMVQ
jgi:hypothetical protein